MKKLIMALAVGIGALALTACQSTSNSPSTNSATACVNGYINGIPCSGTGGVIGGGGLITGPTGGSVPVGGCMTYNTYYWNIGYSPAVVYYVPIIDPVQGPVCQNIGQAAYYNIVNMYSSYGYNYNGSTPIYSCPSGNYYDCYGQSSYGYGGNYSSGLGLCFGIGDDYGNDAGFCI